MRTLQHIEIAAVSGGATPRPTASPLVTVPLALINGLFTVVNFISKLPTLLTLQR